MGYDGLSEAVAATWTNARDRFASLLAPAEAARGHYTTTSIESLNYQLRKVTTNWEQALIQLASTLSRADRPLPLKPLHTQAIRQVRGAHRCQ